MFLSYAIYSKFTDIIGRKNLLMIGLLQVSIGLMLHSIADSVALIVICRLMLGMTVGWLWGLPTILMIEIVPASIRGRVATAGELFFILGIVYLTLCC
jgi:MFS family permease